MNIQSNPLLEADRPEYSTSSPRAGRRSEWTDVDE